MNSTESELRAQAEVINRKLAKIEDARRKEANRKLLGKCFKYRNSYGSGPKWWLYVRVVKIGSYWPETIQFQNTTRGFEVTLEKGFHASIGYTEISRAEYNRALRGFKAKLWRVLT